MLNNVARGEARFDPRTLPDVSIVFQSAVAGKRSHSCMCSCFITYNSLQMASKERDAVSSHNNHNKDTYKGKFEMPLYIPVCILSVEMECGVM